MRAVGFAKYDRMTDTRRRGREKWVSDSVTVGGRRNLSMTTHDAEL